MLHLHVQQLRSSFAGSCAAAVQQMHGGGVVEHTSGTTRFRKVSVSTRTSGSAFCTQQREAFGWEVGSWPFWCGHCRLYRAR
jgi:hypothetical protein